LIRDTLIRDTLFTDDNEDGGFDYDYLVFFLFRRSTFGLMLKPGYLLVIIT
jgi:hypothetical protein